jgi:hypothetical protein
VHMHSTSYLPRTIDTDIIARTITTYTRTRLNVSRTREKFSTDLSIQIDADPILLLSFLPFQNDQVHPSPGELTRPSRMAYS